MARTKGSKNKVKLPARLQMVQANKIVLQIPKDPDRYRLRRAYWYMIMLERQMQIDIKSVRVHDYITAVDKFVKLAKDYKDAQAGVDKKDVAGKQSQGSTPGNSQDRQTGVGVRVPTIDPFA